MRRWWTGLIWLSVAASLWGFFLPWVRLELREPELADRLQGLANQAAEGPGRVTATIRAGGRTITGTLPTPADIPQQVSGAQIPRLAHRPDAQVAIALFELLTNQHRPLGARSYAVYLLPSLALVGGVILTWVGSRRAVAYWIAAASGLIAMTGCWRLLTIDAQALPVAITVGQGLWLSLGGYVGLAVAAAWRALGRLR